VVNTHFISNNYCQLAAVLFVRLSSPSSVYIHVVRRESKVVDRSLAIAQVMYATSIKG